MVYIGCCNVLFCTGLLICIYQGKGTANQERLLIFSFFFSLSVVLSFFFGSAIRISRKGWHMLLNFCFHTALTFAVFAGGINRIKYPIICQAVSAFPFQWSYSRSFWNWCLGMFFRCKQDMRAACGRTVSWPTLQCYMSPGHSLLPRLNRGPYGSLCAGTFTVCPLCTLSSDNFYLSLVAITAKHANNIPFSFSCTFQLCVREAINMVAVCQQSSLLVPSHWLLMTFSLQDLTKLPSMGSYGDTIRERCHIPWCRFCAVSLQLCGHKVGTTISATNTCHGVSGCGFGNCFPAWPCLSIVGIHTDNCCKEYA